MRRLGLALAGLGLLAGCGYGSGGVPAADAPPVNGDVLAQQPAVQPVAAPVKVSIPALDITDEVVPVGLCAKVVLPACTSVGGLEVPDVSRVGYYTGLPKPGENGDGPALLAGHINYGGQAGDFARIGQLSRGDRVLVTDQNGATYEFEVYAVVEFPKAEYEQRKTTLLGDTGTPEVRLFTCSGKIVGHSYLDNTVVSARLVTV